MTLLMYNGFEGYSTPSDQYDAGDGLSYLESPDSISYGTGRNGGKALRNSDITWGNSARFKFPAITNDKIAIAGMAIYLEQMPLFDFTALLFSTVEGSSGCEITLQPDGNLYIKALAFYTKKYTYYLINTNQWYYIEMKVLSHNTTGYCNVRINEQEVLDYSGNLFWSGGTAITKLLTDLYYKDNFLVDDIYVADNQGTENNDYLGDIRIDAIHPNGAGNYVQMTPSVGNNYECVDETELDDTDYVEGANAGEKDSYSYGSVPTDLDDVGIIGVQTKNNCKRTGTAINIKIDPVIRTGSTDYSQTAQDLPDVTGMIEGDIIIEDPSDSLAWTQAKINACEFGMEVG